MKNIDSKGHVTGRSVFLDDIPVIKGTLHAVVVGSSVAHGKIKSKDFSAAEAVSGVISVLTAKDIPGGNQVGGILPDEPLLADDDVHFIGQPVAVIIAKTERIARKARSQVHIEYEEYPAITDPRVAKEKNMLLFSPKMFKAGDTDAAWKKCDHIFDGRVDSGGQ